MPVNATSAFLSSSQLSLRLKGMTTIATTVKYISLLKNCISGVFFFKSCRISLGVYISFLHRKWCSNVFWIKVSTLSLAWFRKSFTFPQNTGVSGRPHYLKKRRDGLNDRSNSTTHFNTFLFIPIFQESEALKRLPV